MSDIVSVVIPTFNAASYLSEALDSVLAQKSDDIELDVVVVDDGSTDNTVEVVSRYGSAVRYYYIPHTGLPGVVRNYALQHIRGSYVSFLDTDDLLLPGSLDIRLAVLKADRSLGFVYANYYEERLGARALVFSATVPPSGWIFDELFARNFIASHTLLVRRSILEQTSGFFPHGKNAEDYWLYLQLARRSRAGFVGEPTAVYRRRMDSVSETALVDKLPDLIRVVRVAGRECEVSSKALYARLNPLRVWLGKEHWRQGHMLRAARYVIPATVTDPTGMARAVLRWMIRHVGHRGLYEAK